MPTGVYTRTDITKAKMSKAQLGNKKNLGKKQSEATKKKIGDAQRGEKNHNFGKRLVGKRLEELQNARRGMKASEETKEKQRKWNIANPNRKFKDTGIELKVEAELQRLNINYQKQVPLCKVAIVDFYLPEYRVIIQADGCYWHGCMICRPTSKLASKQEKDKRKDAVLIFNGFNVYRFWEHEINKSVKECLSKINFYATE